MQVGCSELKCGNLERKCFQFLDFKMVHLFSLCISKGCTHLSVFLQQDTDWFHPWENSTDIKMVCCKISKITTGSEKGSLKGDRSLCHYLTTQDACHIKMIWQIYFCFNLPLTAMWTSALTIFLLVPGVSSFRGKDYQHNFKENARIWYDKKNYPALIDHPSLQKIRWRML